MLAAIRNGLLTSVLILAAGSQSSLAASHALVIGVDAYNSVRRLQGAVNDASDIAERLRRLEVDTLKVLLDGEASRAAVEAAFGDLVARSKPGDLVIFAFAGHGAQEPQRIPGNEQDGKDEVLLLSGFAPSGAGTRERIRDDDIAAWLKRLGERQARALLIIDACHSGTPTRAVDLRAGEIGYRLETYEIAKDQLNSPGPAPGQIEPETPQPHVTSLSAGQDSEKVPELLIDGVKRGALSFALARALEGEADFNRDGVLNRNELYSYMRARTRELADSKQTPSFQPARGDDSPLLRIVPGATSDQKAPPVRLQITGSAAAFGSVAELVAQRAVKIVDGDADLVWDVTARQVVSGKGDVVAHDVSSEVIQAVLERTIAVAQIRSLPRRALAQARVEPSDGLHRAGKELAIVVNDLQNRHLNLISVSGDGTVHWLGLSSGLPELISQPAYKVRTRVESPFGADEIIGFVSATSDVALASRLRALSGQRAAREIATIAADVVKRPDTEIFMQAILTAPTAP